MQVMTSRFRNVISTNNAPQLLSQGTEMRQFKGQVNISGPLNHNSYLVQPTSAQCDAAMIPPPTSPISIDAVKWAKGTLRIDPGSTTTGKLIFAVGPALADGPELAVDFSFETSDEQTVFKGRGVGKAGPLQGVVYLMLGWATVAADGSVTEISGGILAVKGADSNPAIGLGGQPPGTVGYFKLST